MKANELMIGDWVVQDDNLCEDRKCRVTGIFDHCVVEVEGEKLPLHESHIKPIPLTEELLNKNFPNDDIIAWWPCNYPSKVDYFHVEYAKDSVDSLAINICYVHQLQHALRLCGINKETKL